MKNIVLILLLFAGLIVPYGAQSQDVILKTDTISIPCAQADTFLVPVRVKNFTNVGSFQFTLSWNVANLDYAYVTTGGASNPFFLGGANPSFDTLTFINTGKLTFAWNKVGGGSYPDNSVVFYVAFRRIGGPFTPVQLVNTPVGVEVTDPLGEDLPWQIQSGGVKPIDIIAPAITCPANVSQEVSLPTAINGIAPSSVTDNCVLQSVGWTSTGSTTASFPNDPDASGTVFGFGLSTVTYTATDVGGNTATCSFTIDLQPSITTDTLTLLLENSTATCGEPLGIDVTAFNFDSLGSLQFSLNWNTSVLQFDSISLIGSALSISAANFGLNITATGKLSFSWTTASLFGTTIPQGALLFRVYYSVVGSGNTSVQFGDVPTFREAYTSAVQPPEEIPVFYIPGQITIVDNEPPSLICPANIAVVAPMGEITANVTGTAPTSLTDNCSATTLTYNLSGNTAGSGTGNANGTYNAGTTVVTYTATDASGNKATCSFTVSVDAGTSAKLMLEDVAANCQSLGQQITMDFTVADFAEILGLQFTIKWDTSQLKMPKGGVGNFYPGLNLTSFDFQNYQDTTAGFLRFLGGSAAGNWPDIPDNGIFLTLTFNIVGPGPITSVQFLAPLDAVNNAYNSVPVDTLNGVVTSSVDNVGPDFVSCPADMTVNLPSGTCTTTLNFQIAATDDCSGVATIVSNQVDNVFDPGTTSVVYTATDVIGNTSLCAFDVIVVADNVLDITCPSSKTINAPDTACSAVYVWSLPVLNGVCDFTNLALSSNYDPGFAFPVGVTTVVYTVEDTVTNMLASCSFKITVADTTRPVLVCPANVEVSPDSVVNCQALVNFPIATVSDNCDQNLDFDSDYQPGSPFGTGVTVVTYIASDDFSNSAVCTFSITVPDVEPPVLSCPFNITVPATQDACTAIAQWQSPQPFDNCDLSQIPPVSDYLSGELFPVGTTTVTYTAEDNSGNVASCTFSVTVQDTQLPVLIGCPGNLLVQLPIDQCDTLLALVAPTATDNCGQPTLNVDVQPGYVFLTGVTVVTYTALDNATNTASCSFSVTVVDQVAPVFASCPQDTVINTTDPCGAIYGWTVPSATDNCTLADSLVYTSSQMPTDSFLVGISTVVITVKDLSGNTATCTFQVTVNSSFNAQFINVPDSIVLNTTGCTAVATWNPPTIQGFCQVPVITSNYEPGDTFPIGTTMVIYTATNALGGTSMASFKVIVQESVPPQLTCPTADIIVSVTGAIISDPGGFLSSVDTANGCTGVLLEFNNPTAIDNCGDALVSAQSGISSGEVFPTGTTVLTFQASDGSDNTSTCSFNIIVQPLDALTPSVDPNPGCPGEEVTLSVPDIPGATYIWTGPQQSYPNSPIITLISLQQGNTGTYSVVASLNGCSTPAGFAQVRMVAKPDAVNDLEFVIDPGATDTFNVLLNDVILIPDDIQVTQLSQLDGLVYVGDGKFTYTAGTKPGAVSFIYQICSRACPDVQYCDMATVTILIKDIDCTFIPNIFTPNGDNVNDWLVIKCLDGGSFEQNSIVIYNQWGDKVYEASPYNNDETKAWRGTLNGEGGKDLPDGVYYYVFRAGPDKAALKGFIEIYR